MDAKRLLGRVDRIEGQAQVDEWNEGRILAEVRKAIAEEAGADDPMLAEVELELAKAVAKFPTWPTDPLHAVAILGEEFGELTKAVLQTTYERHKVAPGELRTEALQTAAMALRFLRSLDAYTFVGCGQHHQAPVGVIKLMLGDSLGVPLPAGMVCWYCASCRAEVDPRDVRNDDGGPDRMPWQYHAGKCRGIVHPLPF